MKIRIINDRDWEKSYEFDKSIIRVGSQIGSDVLIRDNDVPPLLMQFVRSGTVDVRNTMRFFAENVMLTRGDQSFPAEVNLPYEVLDGDKIGFNSYRMIITLETGSSRVRQTEHIRADMFLSQLDLSPDIAISGGLLLKNLGTQRPCQFTMHITGIPEECLTSAPMPYLHPDASSSVGFMISHLKTKPSPGFHTVSIILSAPNDYYGEKLEFNQDIYVQPVFENEMILEDDSEKLGDQKLNGKNKQKEDTETKDSVSASPVIRDTGMMNMDESVYAINTPRGENVRVLKKENEFEDNEDEDEELPGYHKKRERVVVIRSDDDKYFEGEAENTDAVSKEKTPAEPAPQMPRQTRSSKRVKKSEEEQQIRELKAQAEKARAEMAQAEAQRTVPKPIDSNVPVFRGNSDSFLDEEPEDKQPSVAPAEPEVKDSTENGIADQAHTEQELPVLSPEAEKPKTEADADLNGEKSAGNDAVSGRTGQAGLGVLNGVLGSEMRLSGSAEQETPEAEAVRELNEMFSDDEPREPKPVTLEDVPGEQPEELKAESVPETEPEPVTSDAAPEEQPEEPKADSGPETVAEPVTLDAAPEVQPEEQPEEPKAESEPETAAEPVTLDAAPEVQPEEQPEEPKAESEPEAELVTSDTVPEVQPEEPKTDSEPETAEEPVTSDTVPEVQPEEPKTENEPEAEPEQVTSDILPEVQPEEPKTESEPEAAAEAVPLEDKPEKQPKKAKAKHKPETEPEQTRTENRYENAEHSDTARKTKKKKNTETTFGDHVEQIAADGTETSIPVYRNLFNFGDLDFADEEEPQAADEKKPEIRVVKGGDFE